MEQSRRQRLPSTGEAWLPGEDLDLTSTRNRLENVKCIRLLAEVFWQDTAILAASVYRDTSEMEGVARNRSPFFDLAAFRNPQDAKMLNDDFRVLVRRRYVNVCDAALFLADVQI